MDGFLTCFDHFPRPSTFLFLLRAPFPFLLFSFSFLPSLFPPPYFFFYHTLSWIPIAHPSVITLSPFSPLSQAMAVLECRNLLGAMN